MASPGGSGHGDAPIPRDRILCLGRFDRLVAACMHHCPQGTLCDRFWAFFRERNLTPVAYYNRDGVGEAVMRRIVFDCDRCGRKDVTPVFSRYGPMGEGPEHLLSREGLLRQMADHGYDSEVLADAVFGVMALADEASGWKHLCDRCFGRLTFGIAQFLRVRPAAAARMPSADDAAILDEDLDLAAPRAGEGDAGEPPAAGKAPERVPVSAAFPTSTQALASAPGEASPVQPEPFSLAAPEAIRRPERKGRRTAAGAASNPG